MALIACPDCRSNISDQSKTCIHCGRPLNDRSSPQHTNIKTYIAWGLCLSLVGVIAFRLYALFGLPFDASGAHQLLDEHSSTSTTSYQVGPYAQALMKSDHPSMEVDDKRLAAALMERQLMINRTAPRLVNPMLTLKDVNYRQSQNSFEYNYIVNDLLDPNMLDGRLQRGLDGRFCESEEFRVMRENDVRVIWRYWNKNGILLATLTSGRCN